MAILKAKRQGQAAKQPDEIDDLAERLGDAKVGQIDGDVDMDGLMNSLEGF